ncbi:MAG TPA: thioredoxin domain-containing protein, partial [Tahibacter sp.]|nr:thioredoxin domain-containing protein [Tahibacter sp.]
MPNRLASATSPYLRQHADNPVDWHPWDAIAIALARDTDRPILLSVGYAACHWCHVMAHECFEHDATARVMNDLFVCIKVDREERPDLDKVYQLAHQALTGRGGGWPLTVFLTPDDHLPFYAGTYFPREAKHGLPPFAYVLEQVRGFWDTRRDQVREQNRALAQFLDERAHVPGEPGAPDATSIRSALARYAHEFDDAYGGRRGAPKFPHAGELELEFASRDGSRARIEKTLAGMATRGLYDHLGGGFFRYAVDARWEIPHFEKMLYDNAQLLPLYAHAARRFGRDDFASVAAGVVDWLVREMRAPGGAFWATLDADSEGEEGRYYVWQRDDVRALVDADAFAVAERRYGLDRAPNFEHHAWHLTADEPLGEIARLLSIAPDDAAARLERARTALLAQRDTRVRPGLDDKILTSWNALMCAGLARASRDLAQPAWQALADDALRFVHANLWIDGRLYACHAGGRAQFAAYLDDYAYLLDALLDALQGRWNAGDLAWALALADALLTRFEDRERGGFFFTAHDHEALIQRPKPWLDESTPSGNGVAARVLLRLGHLVGDTRWLDAAERTLRAASGMLADYPHACATLLVALDEWLHPRTHVVVRCDRARAA